MNIINAYQLCNDVQHKPIFKSMVGPKKWAWHAKKWKHWMSKILQNEN